ncbi:gamma-glutamyltransferase [Aquibacillus albus]|uniref:Glutathione hydrolase proenzyme n=1 Tax=Aquibacillus albus TaxID=1168171 RepID=A0ABS2MYK0_9BACI|nr:gamma-glutamyltransferase [Aquibacillus albus]MBM7570750.1 gamma-glutamyltranspeptidase/glutathione hydrolase [Aquibacillus albus]
MKKRTWYIFIIAVTLLALFGINYFNNENRLIRHVETEMSEHRTNQENKQQSLVNYAVTSDHPIATEIGMKILENGGNAVDAGIAVSYALSVLKPYSSGLGGGGVMLIHPPHVDEPVVYNYRETSPSSGRIPNGGIGVPGFVKGMEQVHSDFGSISMEALIEPSAYLAEEGIIVSKTLENRLNGAAYRMPVDELDDFYPGGTAIRSGNKLVQSELANTLRLIQQNGKSAFYEGKLAENMAATAGMNVEDLKSYKVKVEAPLKGSFSGYNVFAPQPPTGGIMLIQTLQMAEALGVKNIDVESAEYIHLIGEISRRSYQDRLEHVGDPAFVQVPVEKIIDSSYTKEMAQEIRMDKQNQSFLSPLDSKADENDEGNTTHFVVVDGDGMMVSATNSLSNFFGSGEYVNGVFLNNQLDNFSNSQHSPNAYEPGKRPYSYISPSIFAKEGEPVIGIGSAGGRRITTTLLDVITRIIYFDETLEDAVNKQRFFVEYNTETLSLESSVSNAMEQSFHQLGYVIDYSKYASYFGSVQTLMIDYDSKTITGGSDSRREGGWSSRKID